MPPSAPPDTARFLEAIGRLTIRWANVENAWYMIFVMLYGIGRNGEIAINSVNAIYQSHRSGGAQREMTFNYAKAILGDSDPLIAKLGSIKALTGKVAGVRNDVQHASFVIVGSAGNYRFAPNPMIPSRLSDTDVIAKIEAADLVFDEFAREYGEFIRAFQQRPVKVAPSPAD